MSHTSTFDSWGDQVRWFVDQVAARFIQRLTRSFNVSFNTLRLRR